MRRFQRDRTYDPLRSSTDRTLTVPRTHNRLGDKRFAVAGPRLWNSLPISLRQISSSGQFRRYLKNHLFEIWEITTQCDAWFSPLYKYSYPLTYLLTDLLAVRCRARTEYKRSTLNTGCALSLYSDAGCSAAVTASTNERTTRFAREFAIDWHRSLGRDETLVTDARLCRLRGPVAASRSDIGGHTAPSDFHVIYRNKMTEGKRDVYGVAVQFDPCRY